MASTLWKVYEWNILTQILVSPTPSLPKVPQNILSMVDEIRLRNRGRDKEAIP